MSQPTALSLPKITAQQAAIELLIFATAAGAFIVAETLHVPKRWTIPAVLLALSIYTIAVLHFGHETWRDLGVRLDNFWSCARPTGWFTLAAVVVVAVWAQLGQHSIWRPELAVLLPIYPLYSIAQQLIFQGIVLRRLLLLLRRPWMAVGGGAVAFSLVHLGDWRLVVLTLLAGGIWSAIFLRRPNVWALGIAHGILAALVYPLLLEDNPLKRL